MKNEKKVAKKRRNEMCGSNGPEVKHIYIQKEKGCEKIFDLLNEQDVH